VARAACAAVAGAAGAGAGAGFWAGEPGAASPAVLLLSRAAPAFSAASKAAAPREPPHGGDPWSPEQGYVESRLEALGAALLAALGERYTDPASLPCDPASCSMVPFWVEPSCFATCDAARRHGRHRDTQHCWLCSRWVTKLHSALHGAEASGGRAAASARVMQMPVLDHVLRLAALAMGSGTGRGSRAAAALNRSIGAEILDEVEGAALRTGVLRGELGQADSGGGGGMGLQLTCDGVLRLTLGGGGGGGAAVEPHQPGVARRRVLSFGGGRGAGMQIFAADGARLGSLGGGGGGGVVLDDDGPGPAARVHAINVSFGAHGDDDSAGVTPGALAELWDQLRDCWRRGALDVAGGGGLGGGFTRGPGGGPTQASGELSFSLLLVKNPCQGACLPDSLAGRASGAAPTPTPTPTQQTPPLRCRYEEARERTVDCASRCAGQPYGDCMCPCFRTQFETMDCEWAQRMTCRAR
jgi:hypothetical protein